MDIGEAVEAMRKGKCVARSGWNGQGMWIQLKNAFKGPGAGAMLELPYVRMRTVGNELVPWVCSQTDLLADDWEIVK